MTHPPPTEADLIALTEKVNELVRENWRLRVELEAKTKALATHDLCHNLDGSVSARQFADGCTAEQRRIHGCAPDADEVERLKAQIEGHCERIAKQSELLSRRAEGSP